MRTSFTVAVAAVAAAGWAFVAGADGTGLRPRRPGVAAARGFERLNLTDQQRDQLKSIRQKNRQAARPLVDAVREARAGLQKAMEGEKPDAASVGQATLALRDAREKLQASRRATVEEMRSVLTPEQLEKLDARTHAPRGRRGGAQQS